MESWFSAWQNCSETPLFLLSEDLQEIRYRFWLKENDAGAKTEAIARWQEAKTRLLQAGFALENFVEEAKFLRETVAHLQEWEGNDSHKDGS